VDNGFHKCKEYESVGVDSKGSSLSSVMSGVNQESVLGLLLFLENVNEIPWLMNSRLSCLLITRKFYKY